MLRPGRSSVFQRELKKLAGNILRPFEPGLGFSIQFGTCHSEVLIASQEKHNCFSSLHNRGVYPIQCCTPTSKTRHASSGNQAVHSDHLVLGVLCLEVKANVHVCEKQP
ncbi:hypothetical protein CH063_00623 [Colletotrichum higginsianum]|uniref:Uncharacterized protein n=1 Tax=Colletotrichum higginsianum (strain IMI 349063) TaxID=759273 RepID=H1W219_COLHI|nr:hypothetical protein CH063_00623 [Colletotrichum higginsianum]